MRITLKASLTAIMLTSVAAVPLATATTFLTADAAYAKSDKAKGKGSGKSGIKIKGKSGTKGKSGDRSASKGGHGGLDGFLGKLTGKDKKASRTASASATTPAAKSNGKVKVAKSDPMHPSNLGNMNGALNSSPNAMLAHIRNGNTNGPVGQLAALAVARSGAEGAQELLDQEQAFVDLEMAITDAGYADLEDYLAKKEGIEVITALDEAIAAAEFNEDPELQDGLDQAVADALEENGFETIDHYEMAVMGDTPVQAIEDDLIELGYNEEDGSFAEERPAEEDVAGAEEALQAEDDATTSILDYWNKGDSTSEGSDELLAALQAKIDANADAIADAIPEEMEMDDEMGDDEEVVDCDEGVDSCEADEEELAAAE